MCLYYRAVQLYTYSSCVCVFVAIGQVVRRTSESRPVYVQQRHGGPATARSHRHSSTRWPKNRYSTAEILSRNGCKRTWTSTPPRNEPCLPVRMFPQHSAWDSNIRRDMNKGFSLSHSVRQVMVSWYTEGISVRNLWKCYSFSVVSYI